MEDFITLKDSVLSAIESGDRLRLESALKQFADDPSDDALGLIDCGIVARNAGRYDDADSIFERVLSVDARNPFALYEIAWSKFLGGDRYSTLRYLNQLLEYHPNDYRGLLFAIRTHCAMEWFGPIDKYLEALRALYPDDHNADVWGEYRDFLSHYPKAYGVYSAMTLEASANFVNADKVFELVRSHIQQRAGFSLIRMGDGEGAFINVSEDDECRYANLYRHNRVDRSNVWFNGELNIYESGFFTDASRISRVMREADVVGVPYSSRMQMEYEISSIVSVASLVNILRLAEYRQEGKYLCSQDIHMDFAMSGRMRELLHSVSEIGLISCHHSLPNVLQTKYGLENIDFYKIPGEKLFNHAIGESSAQGNHYPDRYNEILQSLDTKDLSGKLFLVAGGILGKFYCEKIKQRGGVALDIGSLADAWVGAITRPQHAALIAAIS